MDESIVFRTDPQKLQAFIRRQLAQSVFVKTVLYTLIIFVMVVYMKMEGVQLWVFVGMMVLGLTIFSWIKAVRNIRHTHQVWDAYQLEVNKGKLLRKQPLYQDLEMPVTDLRISNVNRHGFVLKGGLPHEELFLPVFLDDLPGALRALNLDRSSKEPVSMLKSLQKLADWLSIPLLVGMFVSPNRWVVAACTALLLGNFGYAMYRMYTSALYDQQTKKKLWRLTLYFLVFLSLALYKIWSGRPEPIFAFFLG